MYYISPIYKVQPGSVTKCLLKKTKIFQLLIKLPGGKFGRSGPRVSVFCATDTPGLLEILRHEGRQEPVFGVELAPDAAEEIQPGAVHLAGIVGA
jgi:hypothetical protein